MTTQEEVTIVETQRPTQVVTTTTNNSEPQAKGEAPQTVYEKKKTILRFNQIIWYILGFIEVLLMFRFVLKMLGANQFVGFTSLIYAVTFPFAVPFSGIIPATVSGYSQIEWSTIIAGIVFLCIAWGFVYFLEIVYPITPRDIETES